MKKYERLELQVKELQKEIEGLKRQAQLSDADIIQIQGWIIRSYARDLGK